MNKLDSNKLIYITGFLVSLLLLGLFFIDINSPVCIMSMSVGASLIGAIGLAISIDAKSDSVAKKRNKKQLRYVNIEIYTNFFELLMLINILIKECLDKIQQQINFNEITIKELIILYSKKIDIIEEEYDCSNNKIKAKVDKFQDALEEKREKFSLLKEKFNTYKKILLINEISDECQIMKIQAFLTTLSIGNNKLSRKMLFEIGESFKNVIKYNLTDVFNMLGFDELLFDNEKGYFNCK